MSAPNLKSVEDQSLSKQVGVDPKAFGKGGLEQEALKHLHPTNVRRNSVHGAPPPKPLSPPPQLDRKRITMNISKESGAASPDIYTTLSETLSTENKNKRVVLNDNDADTSGSILKERAQQSLTLFNNAQKYAQATEFSKSLDNFNQVVQITAESGMLREIHVKSLFARGQTQKHLENYELAFKDYSEAIKIAPYIPNKNTNVRISQYIIQRANLYFKIKDNEAAIKDYDYALDRMKLEDEHKPNSNDPKTYSQLHANRGRAYGDLDQTEKCVSDLQESIKYNDKNAEAYFYLAEHYKKSHNITDAIDYYKKAIIADPSHVFANINLGNILHEKRQFSEAEQCFRRIVENDPNDLTAKYNLGICLKSQDKNDQAVVEFEKILQSKKPDQLINAELEFARALVNRDSVNVDNEKVLNLYNGYINLKNNLVNSGVFFERGVILTSLNRHEEAVKDFSSAISLDANMLESFFNRGILYSKHLNRLDDALLDFDRVLMLDPNDSEALVERSKIFLRSDRINHALNDLHSAAKMQPQDKQISDLIEYATTKLQK
ncbi:UDP-N-acetylglucosamine-peptide N-acetylglucosaminyltransferase [Acrasis kona]|uniref:UDP-N-acetylglucosamine-peptide N-acetylglucosaminyltransferase n=1 Tax=Acrasis kona TaxID=1008807 RepID=A0AAW2Z375_9EUKA